MNPSPEGSFEKTSNDDSSAVSAVTQAAELSGLHPALKQKEGPATGFFYKKKWRDYFFEFFMLFLAITLGFFVENKRENISDNKKEKEYMRSFVEDLKSDTLKVDSIMRYNPYIFSGLDSMINTIYSYKKNDTAIIAKLYTLYTTYTRNYYNVNFTDRTIRQLKNGGNMRLIRSQMVSDSIIYYDDWAKLTTDQGILNKEKCEKALDLSTSIFDYRYLRYNPSLNGNNILPAASYRLLTDDPIVLSRYANQLEIWKNVIWMYMTDIMWQKIRAKSLISFIKNEYGLH